MTGNITINISERGIGIDADLQNVDLIDKYELLHAMTIGLGMSRREIEVYCAAEVAGVLCDAMVRKVSTDVELSALVTGGEVPGDEG